MTSLLTGTPLRARGLDGEALAALAGALLGARAVWEGAARFDPEERRPVRLLADEHFEAWVIGWCPGQSLGLHDHGDSAGALVVADGRLHETTLVRAPHMAHHETRALERGVVRRVPRRAVHGVANFEARPATSLHVYSPPLHRMTHFDSDGLRAVETIGVEPERPLLPAAVGELLRIARRV